MPNSTDDSKNQSKDTLIADILSLLSDVSEKFEPENLETKQRMMKITRNPKVIQILLDATFMELRVLAAIGSSEPINGITISKQFRIPKGTVSKITRRLIAKNLITKETLPNNKKEIHFRITSLGRELFTAHQAFDQQMEKNFVQFLKAYKANELNLVARILRDFKETSF
ncbi:MAG TPA: MarR family transcriptional regulator [Anaerolineales bacterium]|nr:MarR family transcriptional regulator [Anaerolineales bacterium]